MTVLTAKDLNDMARYAMPEELEYLTRLSFDLGSFNSFVMIGAGPGVMALAVFEGQDRHFPSPLWVIDNDPERFYYMNKHLEAAEAPGWAVHCIEGDSAEVGKTWHAEVDLLIIDGDHSYEGVSRDIGAWLPNVAHGGYIFFHDYLTRPGGFNGVEEWKMGDVAKAVDGADQDWEYVESVGISVVYRKN